MFFRKKETAQAPQVLSNEAIAIQDGMKVGKNFSVTGTVSYSSEPYLITIGDNVRISDHVNFVTHDGGVHVIRQLKKIPADIFGKITIGNNVFIGMGTTILPNVTIGNNVIIGAGSVVTKNIPDNTVACGVPAKAIKSINDYYNKNKDSIDLTKDMTPEEKKAYLFNKFKLDK